MRWIQRVLVGWLYISYGFTLAPRTVTDQVIQQLTQSIEGLRGVEQTRNEVRAEQQKKPKMDMERLCELMRQTDWRRQIDGDDSQLGGQPRLAREKGATVEKCLARSPYNQPPNPAPIPNPEETQLSLQSTDQAQQQEDRKEKKWSKNREEWEKRKLELEKNQGKEAEKRAEQKAEQRMEEYQKRKKTEVDMDRIRQQMRRTDWRRQTDGDDSQLGGQPRLAREKGVTVRMCQQQSPSDQRQNPAPTPNPAPTSDLAPTSKRVNPDSDDQQKAKQHLQENMRKEDKCTQEFLKWLEKDIEKQRSKNRSQGEGVQIGEGTNTSSPLRVMMWGEIHLMGEQGEECFLKSRARKRLSGKQLLVCS